jgi:hypothetical protein
MAGDAEVAGRHVPPAPLVELTPPTVVPAQPGEPSTQIHDRRAVEIRLYATDSHGLTGAPATRQSCNDRRRSGYGCGASIDA